MPISMRRGRASIGAVCVNSGKNQVSSERRVDGDRGGFIVADLTDQNHIRILADNGAQSVGEGVSAGSRNLRLGYPFDFVFYRIFNR